MAREFIGVNEDSRCVTLSHWIDERPWRSLTVFKVLKTPSWIIIYI